MTTVQREFAVHRACGEVVARIRRELGGAGFRTEQSFDLRSALAVTPSCTCPHHGTTGCDCQYNVLLLYGRGAAPLTLVIHGHDGQSWIELSGVSEDQQVADVLARVVRTLAAAQTVPPSEAGDYALHGIASG